MSMDLARKDFSTAPEYFIAGTDIGIAKATKTASAAVEAHAPVLISRSWCGPGGSYRSVWHHCRQRRCRQGSTDLPDR